MAEKPQDYKRSRSRWKRFRRRAVALAVGGTCNVLALLPFAITRRVFPRVTRLFAYRALRGATVQHLDFAYGDAMPKAEKTRIAKTIAYNIGLTLAEVLAASRGKLPQDYIDEHDAVQKTLDALGDQGFLGLTGHIGNWELCGMQLNKHFPERADSVIAKRLGNPGLNAWIEKTRAKLGMETFYQNESPMRLVRGLRQGKIIGTVPDQDIARLAGEFVPFFGHPAYTPTGPAMLALHGKVAIVPAVMRRTKTGLKLIAYDPIWPDFDADKKEEITRLTRAWSDALESAIREQPSDWMWFHKRWETTPERLAARREKRMSKEAG